MSSQMQFKQGDSPANSLTLRVYRSNPTQQTRSYYQTFAIPREPGMTVLAALLYAKEKLDHSIAIRFSCRMASCGSCGMKINGLPKLACYIQVSDYGDRAITVEPLDSYPLVRDLVTDFRDFFEKHKSIKPFLIRRDVNEPENASSEYVQSQGEVDDFLQFSYCIKCGLCNAACPTLRTDPFFTGPQALGQAYRYVIDTRDEGVMERIDAVDHSHGVWKCHFPAACTFVCPKGVDPALAIQRLKRVVVSPVYHKKKGAPILKRQYLSQK